MKTSLSTQYFRVMWDLIEYNQKLAEKPEPPLGSSLLRGTLLKTCRGNIYRPLCSVLNDSIEGAVNGRGRRPRASEVGWMRSTTEE